MNALRVGLGFLVGFAPPKADVIVMEDGRWTKWSAMSESTKCAVRDAIMLVSNHERSRPSHSRHFHVIRAVASDCQMLLVAG